MMGPARARRLALAAQTLLSAALLAWLLAQVEWREVAGTLASASPAVLGVGVGVYYGGVVLSCWKWRLLLGLERVEVGMGRLVRWYLIGAFANNFLPTDVGGDLGRGYLAGRTTGRPVAVARSILLERLTGLLFMLLLAWAGAVLLLPWGALVLGLSAIGLLAACGLWAAWRQGRRHRAVSPRAAALVARLPAQVRAVGASSAAVARQGQDEPGTLARILLISLAFQVLAGLGLWLNLYAVGVLLPVAPVVLAAALASVAGLLPFSLNGWGVREALLVTLLAPLGASAAAILAGALLARMLVLVLSSAGAALLPLERGAAPEATRQEQQPCQEGSAPTSRRSSG
jgi:uncharacterized membrane protein YbhN (UPF0104 family)